MATVFFEVRARGFEKLNPRGKSQGSLILPYDEIKSDIVHKINEIALLGQQALQATVPFRSGDLQDNIVLTKATERNPVAIVYLHDGVHHSESSRKASNGDISTNQKELEAYRTKAIADYDRKKRAEATERAKPVEGGFGRTRKRVHLNAGAHALSNIELAFLLEIGGATIGKGIGARSRSVASRVSVHLGEEHLTEKQAKAFIEKKFKKLSGKRKTLDQAIEKKAIAELAARKETAARDLRKHNAGQNRALGKRITSLVDEKEALLSRLKSLFAHKDKIDNAKNTPQNQAKLQEILDDIAKETPTLKRSLVDLNRKIGTAAGLVSSKYSFEHHRATIYLENQIKELNSKKVLEDQKIKSRKEILEPHLSPFRHPPEGHADTKSRSTPKDLHRKGSSKVGPAEGDFSSPGAGTETRGWIENAQKQLNGKVDPVLKELSDKIVNSIEKNFAELQSKQRIYLRRDKKAGITSNRPVY